MNGHDPKAVAVIFAAQRIADDGMEYALAASEMERLAAQQPGFIAMESARGGDGFGITVSYWESEAAALQWRDHPRHAQIRADGRARWYASYRVTVARVERQYAWALDGSAR